LGSINITVLNPMVEFQMLHQFKFCETGRRLLVTGSDSTFEVAMTVLDVLNELGLRICRSSFTVTEWTGGVVMSGS
jgi:hypothetical protein